MIQGRRSYLLTVLGGQSWHCLHGLPEPQNDRCAPYSLLIVMLDTQSINTVDTVNHSLHSTAVIAYSFS
jgi:hypothetical protein